MSHLLREEWRGEREREREREREKVERSYVVTESAVLNFLLEKS